MPSNRKTQRSKKSAPKPSQRPETEDTEKTEMPETTKNEASENVQGTKKRKRPSVEKYEFTTEKEMLDKLSELESQKHKAHQQASERVEKTFAPKFKRYERAREAFLKEHENPEDKKIRNAAVDHMKTATKEEIICFQQWKQEIKKRRQEFEEMKKNDTDMEQMDDITTSANCKDFPLPSIIDG